MGAKMKMLWSSLGEWTCWWMSRSEGGAVCRGTVKVEMLDCYLPFHGQKTRCHARRWASGWRASWRDRRVEWCGWSPQMTWENLGRSAGAAAPWSCRRRRREEEANVSHQPSWTGSHLLIINIFANNKCISLPSDHRSRHGCDQVPQMPEEACIES